MLTRQTTHQKLYTELGNFKSCNIDLQIRIEEQRRELVALRRELKKAKAKIALYRELNELKK